MLHYLAKWRNMKITFLQCARNARIASAVLATAIPSICLSVTRRYCVKTTVLAGGQPLPPEILPPSDMPYPVNFLREMSELITQERIAVGSSNLVEGLTT